MSRFDEIIGTLLAREEFAGRPPILVDIGASGDMPAGWKALARHCVCVAFDADTSQMDYAEKEGSGYKKLFVVNRVVTEDPPGTAEFYVTRYPHCSSVLEPDTARLKDWAFAELFHVEKSVRLKTTDLATALSQLDIRKLDRIKLDSQGTDLRIFRSLGEERIRGILVAEFEPGILDAYKGEDKLYSLMHYMDDQPFWVSDIILRGTQRIDVDVARSRLDERQRSRIDEVARSSPGWAEITYFNDFKNESMDRRDFLLGWVFAVSGGQYGFALELAVKGNERFGDRIFSELERESLQAMQLPEEPGRSSLKTTYGAMRRIVHAVRRRLP